MRCYSYAAGLSFPGMSSTWSHGAREQSSTAHSDSAEPRSGADAEGLQASTVQVFSDFGDGAVASAIEKHRTFGNPKFQRGNHLRSVIEVRPCKRCGQHWVKYVVEKQSGNDWKEIPNLTTAGFTDQVVDI